MKSKNDYSLFLWQKKRKLLSYFFLLWNDFFPLWEGVEVWWEEGLCWVWWCLLNVLVGGMIMGSRGISLSIMTNSFTSLDLMAINSSSGKLRSVSSKTAIGKEIEWWEIHMRTCSKAALPNQSPGHSMMTQRSGCLLPSPCRESSWSIFTISILYYHIKFQIILTNTPRTTRRILWHHYKCEE